MSSEASARGRANRRAGRDYEATIGNYFTSRGFGFINTNRSGYDGDDWTLKGYQQWLSGESKKRREESLGAWLDKARSDADGRLPVVVHKRWGKGDPADAFVSMSLADFCTILETIGKGAIVKGGKRRTE
jgi:hypothetical protein